MNCLVSKSNFGLGGSIIPFLCKIKAINLILLAMSLKGAY